MKASNLTVFETRNGKLSWVLMSEGSYAEHEFGIESLQRSFKLDSTKVGLERRKIRKLPLEYIRFTTDLSLKDGLKSATMLMFGPYLDEDSPQRAYERFDHQLMQYRDGTASAWSEKDFAIVSENEEHQKYLAELHDAIKGKRVALLYRCNPFSRNNGLSLVITDNVDEEVDVNLSNSDLDRIKLAEASDRTGIINRLNKTKEISEARSGVYFGGRCSYFACSPRWIDEKRKGDSIHPVIYWLNPYDQKNNNFGWFTVEELDQWIKGCGPIPKTQSKNT